LKVLNKNILRNQIYSKIKKPKKLEVKTQ